jgi:hypothetical protein
VMSEGSEELATFLDSVFKSQTSADEGWRNMGRGFGLYFLATVATGVEIHHALQLTASYQQAIAITLFRPQPPNEEPAAT